MTDPGASPGIPLSDALAGARGADRLTRIEWRGRIAAHGVAAIDAISPWVLESEYGAESRLEPARWAIMRWWKKDGADEEFQPETSSDMTLAVDTDGRGVVWIANRPAQAEPFEQIVVMQGGRVALQGAPAELAARGGLYTELMASA